LASSDIKQISRASSVGDIVVGNRANQRDVTAESQGVAKLIV
jgi:hypothetical protein